MGKEKAETPQIHLTNAPVSPWKMLLECPDISENYISAICTQKADSGLFSY